MSDIDAIWSDAKRGFNSTLGVWKAIRHGLLVLSRPLAFTTQVFLRHKYGERFLTPVQAFLTLGLVVAMTGLEVIARKATAELVYDIHGRVVASNTRNEGVPVVLGICWCIALLIAFARQFVSTYERYQQRERWHSMCMGVTVAPWLTNAVQHVIVFVGAAIMLLSGCYVFGLLMLVSMTRSMAGDANAAAEFYNRVLDAIDGQIEADNLEKAVEDRTSGAATEGLYARLPSGRLDTLRNPRRPVESSASAEPSAPVSAEVEAKPGQSTGAEARPTALADDFDTLAPSVQSRASERVANNN